jgi:trans-2,3-dihydro-3-hydroxyanthranilate isomerase
VDETPEATVATLPFFIADVFTDRKYAGNQLAVVLQAGDLDARVMQTIAREMNFSETCFLLGESDKGHRARIFTPAREVPFAGHPTLGMAYVIREVLGTGGDRIRFDLPVGRIPVTYEASAGLYWMRQIDPVFGRRIPVDEIAGVLGLEPADFDERFPVQEVSTGIPFVIAPLRSLQSVRRCRVDPERFDAFVENGSGQAVFVFAPEAEESGHDIHARMFAGPFGVPEDPATGSANGCLAGYLVRYAALGDEDVAVRVEQGYEIGRPSVLHLRAAPEGDGIRVEVGGGAVLVARGELV